MKQAASEPMMGVDILAGFAERAALPDRSRGGSGSREDFGDGAGAAGPSRMAKIHRVRCQDDEAAFG